MPHEDQQPTDDAVQDIIDGKYNHHYQDDEEESQTGRPIHDDTGISDNSSGAPTKELPIEEMKKETRDSSTKEKSSLQNINHDTDDLPSPVAALHSREQTSGTVGSSSSIEPSPTTLVRHTDRTAISRPGAVPIPGVVALPLSSDETPENSHHNTGRTNDARQHGNTSSVTINLGGNSDPPHVDNTTLVSAQLVTTMSDLEQGNNNDYDAGLRAAVTHPAPPLVKAEAIESVRTSQTLDQNLSIKEVLKIRSVQVAFASISVVVIFVAVLVVLFEELLLE